MSTVDMGEQPARRRPCGFEPGKPCRGGEEETWV